MKEELIAPCGMNCGICSRYLAGVHEIRSKGVNISYCTGCRDRNKQCAFVKKRCSLVAKGQIKYCYECSSFPCENLLKLDKKYRSLFRMSMVENLRAIKQNGIGTFLKNESDKWRCAECGDTVSCHNGICFNCGLDLLKKRDKKNILRWADK